MSNLKKANDIVKANVEKGAKVIRALILIEGIAITDKEVTVLLKDNGVGNTSSVFTPAKINAFLEEGRTEAELYKAIIEAKSGNAARWVNSHNNVRIVINKVYAKLGNEVKEEAASEKLKAELKTLIPVSKTKE